MSSTADLSLAEAEQQLYYGAECAKCHEVRRVDLKAAMAKLGEDYPLGRLKAHIRCAKCGSKADIVVTLWKSAMTSTRLMENWK